MEYRDDINSDRNCVKFFPDDAKSTDELQDDMPAEWKYNEADRLEDEVLFPWERKSVDVANGGQPLQHNPADAEEELLASQGRMHRFETLGPNFKKWAYDLDTDEEVSDFECTSECGSHCDKHEQGALGWYSDDDEIDYDDDDEEEIDYDEEDEDWEEGSLDDGPDRTAKDPEDDKYAAIDKNTPLADAIITRFGLAVDEEPKLSDEERLKAVGKAVGFPGASSWEELWSNLLDAKPATAEDTLDAMQDARPIDFGDSPSRIGGQEPPVSNAVAKKTKEKKLTKSQMKAQSLEDFNMDLEIHIDRERAACKHTVSLVISSY